MRAFFLSVSASFSTTFCFWAAMSSFVFSLSLEEKTHSREAVLETGEAQCSPQKPTLAEQHTQTSLLSYAKLFSGSAFTELLHTSTELSFVRNKTQCPGVCL